MSVRPQCSYWVTITGPQETLSGIIELLLKRRHALNYMTVACTATDIEMEVTDGATEQTEEVETLCRTLARDFPDADISYREVNEELYTPDRFMTHGRTVRRSRTPSGANLTQTVLTRKPSEPASTSSPAFRFTLCPRPKRPCRNCWNNPRKGGKSHELSFLRQ